MFSTAEDAYNAEVIEDEEELATEDSSSSTPRANFHSAILPQLEKHFMQSLVRRSRVQWATPDDSTLVSCQVSKHFSKGNMDYWFGLKRTTRESLQEHENSYLAFGLGSPERVALLPYAFLEPHLDGMFTSPDSMGGVLHWHVRFRNTEQGVALLANRDRTPIDVSDHLLNCH